jgi:hypothetical protein
LITRRQRAPADTEAAVLNDLRAAGIDTARRQHGADAFTQPMLP